MKTQSLRPTMALALIAFTVLFAVMLACARTIQSKNTEYWQVSGTGLLPAATADGKGVGGSALVIQTPGGPVQIPTPDAPHPLPAMRNQVEQYVVKAGDTLNKIANKYGVSLDQLIQTNEITDPNLVEVGRMLTIPVPIPENAGPAYKVIPDSELVNGPAAAGFDIAGFVQQQGGYLASYYEEVDGISQDGAHVVERVAQDYSVSPRLLLAVLEYQSGWVTQPNPKEGTQNFPIGLRDPGRKGLYRQLAWAANALNRGFYVWRVNGAASWLLADGSVVPVNPTINAGTAGVQNFFAQLYDNQSWVQAVTEQGLFATYNKFFGYPFKYAIEPLLPAGLAQPQLTLPFLPGRDWAFTGGPHGGWGDGSAWAALDFAPPGPALGCVQSDEWVVASAGGVIVRSGNGAVIEDLDGDGLEQTGWAILYMHIETRDRIAAGTQVKAGDRIGHPSCEGGVSNGTHTHLARKYNGEWIPADQSLPFDLDGWVSSGGGSEYDGFLQRGGQSIEAYAGRSADNGIQR